MARTALIMAGLLGFVGGLYSAQDEDPEWTVYKYSRTGVIPDLLMAEIEKAFGFRSDRFVQDYDVTIEGDKVTIRTKKPLTAKQKKILDKIVAETPDARKNPELASRDAIRKRAKKRILGPWQERYAGAKTVEEKVDILAEYMGLIEK